MRKETVHFMKLPGKDRENVIRPYLGFLSRYSKAFSPALCSSSSVVFLLEKPLSFATCLRSSSFSKPESFSLIASLMNSVRVLYLCLLNLLSISFNVFFSSFKLMTSMYYLVYTK